MCFSLFIRLNNFDSPITYPIHITDGPFYFHVTPEPDARRLGNPSSKKTVICLPGPTNDFSLYQSENHKDKSARIDEENKIQKKE
ncbi:hypothetical protein TNCT_449131 [Trichonephila clavata]|uniref:Uncharacterized protein n=1 Tax=Trichonephila clavata TaxID=2740835 RepID=A0A8X6LDI9_TRICU|nr:hypothetical protein TNCT_449131 [Trichonephila clavata]